MNVYKYDEETKEYIGTEPALLDPLETKQQGKNVYLLPANATFIPPTEPPDGYVNVWNGSAWEQVEDNRKQEYWLPEDKYGAPAREIKELGALPKGAKLAAPERTLDEVKTDKVQNLKAERDAREVEPISYNSNSYDYDDKARERINAAIIALEVLEVAGASPTLTWTTADNKDVKVTASDLRGIIAQVALRSNDLHIAYREAKAKVEAATTKEELDAIELVIE